MHGLHRHTMMQQRMRLKKMQTDKPDELEDAFYKELEFGTGGLRGIMGVGTNRMNKIYSWYGYAGVMQNYLKKILYGS